MSHLELYINNLKKLYPNITEDELNKMVEYFVADMKKQEGRYRENELNGTYREIRKVVPNNNI
jgi:Ca2+-binding EF-hand superfamily protein